MILLGACLSLWQAWSSSRQRHQLDSSGMLGMASKFHSLKALQRWKSAAPHLRIRKGLKALKIFAAPPFSLKDWQPHPQPHGPRGFPVSKTDRGCGLWLRQRLRTPNVLISNELLLSCSSYRPQNQSWKEIAASCSLYGTHKRQTWHWYWYCATVHWYYCVTVPHTVSLMLPT